MASTPTGLTTHFYSNSSKDVCVTTCCFSALSKTPLGHAPTMPCAAVLPHVRKKVGWLRFRAASCPPGAEILHTPPRWVPGGIPILIYLLMVHVSTVLLDYFLCIPTYSASISGCKALEIGHYPESRPSKGKRPRRSGLLAVLEREQQRRAPGDVMAV